MAKVATKKKDTTPLAHRRRKVGLADVAARAGVSAATVSRIFNGVKRGFSVTPEIRERVNRAAAELNYCPDLMARSLRSDDRATVAIVSGRWEFFSGIYQTVIQECADGIRNSGGRVYLAFADGSGAIPVDPWMRDGAVVIQPHSLEELQAIEAVGLPYVSVNGVAGPGGSQVTVDDRSGAELAMRHLFAQGHRRIAYVSWFTPGVSRHASQDVRRDVYLAMMQVQGAEPWDADVELDGIAGAVAAAVADWGATAILGYDHRVLSAAMQVARERGWPIPQRFSLLTFNDGDFARLMTPAVTTVGIPAAAMGREAAAALTRMIQDPATREKQVLPEVLNVRDSVAPCRGFTLVEMLVVVAIIALLAALLAPSLQKSLEAARGVSCVNNQKQLYIAVNLYADDNRGLIPNVNYPSATGEKRRVYWMNAIAAQLNFVGWELDQSPPTRYAIGTILHCPSFQEPNYNIYGYGMSLYIPPMDGWDDIQQERTIARWPRLERVRKPGRQVYFAECDNWHLGPWQYEWGTAKNGLRHNGSNNALFCDGHTKGILEADLRFNGKELNGK